MRSEIELFLYELGGHGYGFKDLSYDENGFKDSILNMVWEMWQASANREGYKLVPVEADKKILKAGVDERRNMGSVLDVYKAMINASVGEE